MSLNFSDVEFEIATGLRSLDDRLEQIQKDTVDPELKIKLKSVRNSLAYLRSYVHHVADQLSPFLPAGWKEVIPGVMRVHEFGAKAKKETPDPEKLNAYIGVPDPYDVKTLI